MIESVRIDKLKFGDLVIVWEYVDKQFVEQKMFVRVFVGLGKTGYGMPILILHNRLTDEIINKTYYSDSNIDRITDEPT